MTKLETATDSAAERENDKATTVWDLSSLLRAREPGHFLRARGVHCALWAEAVAAAMRRAWGPLAAAEARRAISHAAAATGHYHNKTGMHISESNDAQAETESKTECEGETERDTSLVAEAWLLLCTRSALPLLWDLREHAALWWWQPVWERAGPQPKCTRSKCTQSKGSESSSSVSELWRQPVWPLVPQFAYEPLGDAAAAAAAVKNYQNEREGDDSEDEALSVELHNSSPACARSDADAAAVSKTTTVLAPSLTLTLTLDTATNNEASQRMYRRNGFGGTGVKKDYYDLPPAEGAEAEGESEGAKVKTKTLDALGMVKGLWVVCDKSDASTNHI